MLALTLCALSPLGCRGASVELRTVGPDEPARRAAQSFVHCVEQDGGGCVGREGAQGAWDAFSILHWMATGSPLSLLEALGRELDHHRDPLAIEDRFVAQAGRYRETLRGAECRPDEAASVAELLPRLVARVEARMEAIGLWAADLEAVVEGLAEEAGRGLGEGWLVRMVCYGDPYQLWVATSAEAERQVVVGMVADLPVWLGGRPLDEDTVEGRLRSPALAGSQTLGVVREGTVDSRWLPIPSEEF